VVVVVFGTQADAVIIASTMITDTANESSVFFFIYVPPLKYDHWACCVVDLKLLSTF